MENRNSGFFKNILAMFVILVLFTLPIHAIDPTTSATGTLSNGNPYSFGTWTSQPVYVTLTCNAGSSDCSSTSYCVDTTNTCDPTSSAGATYTSTLNLSADGSYYLRYASENSTGSWGDMESRTVEVDTTPPVMTLVSDASTTWTNNNIISISVSDGNGSGVVDTRWLEESNGVCDSSLDSELNSSGNEGTSMDANNDSLYQNNYICFRSTDAVGNEAYLQSSQITYLDTTPPIVSAGPDITANSIFTQNGSGSDSGSGVASYLWQQVSGPGTITFGSPNQLDTTVSASTDGTYIIELEATDMAGNDGFSNFTLTWDTTPPMITINNPSTGPAQSKTITASTSKGNLSIAITNGSICDSSLTFEPYTPTNFSSESEDGESICFMSVDAAGNTAYLMSNEISAIDTTKPVITLNGNSTVTIEAKTGYTDAGATATDAYDGDITSKIVVNNSVNPNVIGDYTVTYEVTDAAGNSANEITRTVDVVDTVKPIITLNGNSTMEVNIRSSYVDPGATASDSYYGDITSSIVTNNTVNTNTPGVYTVTYDVTDASGNAAIEVVRTVKVDDPLGGVVLIGGAVVIVAALAGIYYIFIRKKAQTMGANSRKSFRSN